MKSDPAMRPLETSDAAIHADRLDRLTEKGLRAAAVADNGIDWDTRIKKPAWLRMQYVRTAISQLYFGELATITMCERLLRELDDGNAIRFVRTQIADEQRHVRYYERYLARAGGIEDICDGVAMAYEGALAWRGSYHGAIVAFHIVLEGEGLRLQQLYGNWFPCPLYKQINTLIARDDGRHVAFGKIFLRRQLQALPLEERIVIYQWVRALWFDCAGPIQADMPGIVFRAVGRRWAENRWRRQREALIDIGLIHPHETAQFDRC